LEFSRKIKRVKAEVSKIESGSKPRSSPRLKERFAWMKAKRPKNPAAKSIMEALRAGAESFK
jgi:hypothetical protein